MNEKATFAGGCFWCTEAIFTRLRGVLSVAPGYTGGTLPLPTYEQVSTGTTNHAETIEIQFDPNVISYETLLKIFFATHDPTTKDKQGADIGTQYRSAIFYHSTEQKISAEKYIKILLKERTFPNIVTTVIPASEFYTAEDYHQRYFEKNSYQPYCQLVIDPKIQKLISEYRSLLK
jgi:peptide-methionine (S)-S-oxide reductase